MSWIAPLTRSFARPKKKRTANRYKEQREQGIMVQIYPQGFISSGDLELLSGAIISHVTGTWSF